ncbi:uncharacterized protein LOC143376802 [Andrena cerasifolii]|uniref:uncharacterized protein LOC143376802 n=1 Tax=Andrena cerasifolii TaxID=2819439 RepID=UPI0040377372
MALVLADHTITRVNSRRRNFTKKVEKGIINLIHPLIFSDTFLSSQEQTDRIRFGQSAPGWYIRASQADFLQNYCTHGVWDSNARANGIISTIFQIHTACVTFRYEQPGKIVGRPSMEKRNYTE